jgi:hypothetical protein
VVQTWWGHRLPDPEATAYSDLVRGQDHRSQSTQGIGPDQATRTCQEAHVLSIVLMSSTG